MSEEIVKKKVAGIIRTSKGNNESSGADRKRGIFQKLGNYFSSHWVCSAIIFPIVLIVSLGLLFSIKKEGGIKK